MKNARKKNKAKYGKIPRAEKESDQDMQEEEEEEEEEEEREYEKTIGKN